MEYGSSIPVRYDSSQSLIEKDLVKTIRKKFEDMQVLRSVVDDQRWELCSYLRHRTRSSSKGYSPVKDIRLYSADGMRAFDTFIDGFFSGVMSSNQNWFQTEYQDPSFGESDSIEGADKYTSKIDSITRTQLNRSNFYQMKKLALKDSFTCQCSATYMQFRDGRLVYNTLAPWDWWVDTDDAGSIDTFFYRYTITAEKAYKRFGDDLPPKMAKIAANAPYTVFTMLMCVYPRYGVRNAKGVQILSTNKNFAVIDLSLDYNLVVKQSGYDFFPIVVHRASSSGDSPYGDSPFIRALPELRKLNKLAYELGISTAKINHNPVVMTQAVDDKYSDEPGAHIIVTSMDQAPRPLESKQSVDWAYKAYTDQLSTVQRMFYNDYFYYLTRQDKVLTATQSSLLKNEQLDLLSSIFDNTQNENLEPTLRYTMYLLETNGKLPRAPKGLLDTKTGMISFVMNSVMAQQLKISQQRDPSLSGFELLERMTNLRMTEAIDNINIDKLIRMLVKSNVSADVLNEQSTVKKTRDQRAQLQQQQMQLQQAQQASETIRNLGGKSNMNNAGGSNQYA